MVDRLKGAAEHLEAPACPNCHIEMRWFRSELLRDAPVVIAHHFSCPTCKRVDFKESTADTVQAPPNKLSAPRLATAA